MWAGIALSATVLPRTALMLIGGAVSDRGSPRTVLIRAVAVMITACLAFAAITFAIGVPLWLLILFGLLIGTTDAFSYPSNGSMPRLLVGTDLLPRALAMRHSGTQLITLLGAPTGGFLVAWVGMTGVALLDAATFAVLPCALLLLRPNPVGQPSQRKSSVFRDAIDGVGLVVRDPLLRPALLLTAVVASAAIPVATLLVPLLARDLGLSAGAAGLIVSGEAGGSILVALTVSKYGAFSRPGLVAPIGLAITGVGVATLTGVAALPLLVLAAVISGLGLGLFVSHVGPLMLGSSPDGYLSRVQAVIGLAQGGSLLVSNNALGGIAHATSPDIAALVCAAFLFLAAVAAAISRPIRSSRLYRPIDELGSRET